MQPSQMDVKYRRNKLQSASSVFTAELFAIENAMLLINNSNDLQFAIYSDSMSVIHAVAAYKTITQLRWRSEPGSFDQLIVTYRRTLEGLKNFTCYLEPSVCWNIFC